MCVSAHTVNCETGYRKSTVSAFVIEKDGEIKEKFSYEISFNKTTQQSLVAYSHANYGSEAVFREMTDERDAELTARASANSNRDS